MPRDRFLTGILVGIGVLIVSALILFFIRQGSTGYVDDSSPSGVMQNYILALQKRDYERAYSYIADSAEKPDLAQFRQAFLTSQSDQITDTAAEVGEVILDSQDQTASVQVTLLRGPRDLFGETYRDLQTASLINQSGEWKILSAPYPYWSYDWSPPSSLTGAAL